MPGRTAVGEAPARLSCAQRALPLLPRAIGDAPSHRLARRSNWGMVERTSDRRQSNNNTLAATAHVGAVAASRARVFGRIGWSLDEAQTAEIEAVLRLVDEAADPR